MKSMKFCKLCLVTDVKMFNMTTPTTLEAYSHLLHIDCKDNWMYYACYECASLLHKYQRFRNKCLTAHNVLSSININHSMITTELVRNVDRKLHNLVSNLACYILDPCISSDASIKTEPLVITHETIFINDFKSVRGVPGSQLVEECNSEIKFGNEIPIFIDDSSIEVDNTSIDNIQNNDNIPEVIKQHEEAPNLKKRKLKIKERKIEIKQEMNDSDSFDEPLAKRQKKIEYNLMKSSAKVNISILKDYATVVLMTPDDAKKELLLRKQSCNYEKFSHKCQLCYRGYEVEAAFENHMKKHSPEYGSWECEYCHLRFKTKKASLQHYTSVHKYKFICKICPCVWYNKHKSRTHINFHNGKIYKCSECGKTFRTPTTLYAHKAKKHSEERVCGLCGSIFTSKQTLNSHMKHSHIEESNELLGPRCEECDVQFSTEAAWKRHMVFSSKHTVSNGCLRCGETFSSRNDLKIHSKQHSKKSKMWVKKKSGVKLPEACKLCEYLISTRSEYKRHMTSQHPQSEAAKKIEAAEQKPFVCEECGMTFKNRCFLEYHQRKHTGERPYECRQCGRRFRVQGTLYQHENTHTRQRVYQCDLCQKEFNTKSGLVKHLRANHLGIRPYSCSFCDKSFPNPSDLKVHIKYVHYKVPWPKRDRSKRTSKENTSLQC